MMLRFLIMQTYISKLMSEGINREKAEQLAREKFQRES